jgi:hypothetical protein
MKLFQLAILAIFVVSCSSSDSEENVTLVPTNTVKKTIETIYISGTPEQSVINFNYENGILKYLTTNSNYNGEFVYSGGKIVKYNLYENNVLSYTNDMSYDGNFLSEIVNNESLTSFEYQDGKLKTMKYFIGSGVNYSLSKQDDYTYLNNNIYSNSSSNNFGGTIYESKSGFTYDNKNNVFKNMNPYLKYMLSFESIDLLSQNNILEKYVYDSPSSTDFHQSHQYQITYNSANYPIKVKKYSTDVDGNIISLISELVVEYN